MTSSLLKIFRHNDHKVTQKVGYLKMRFLSHRIETDFDLIWKILKQNPAAKYFASKKLMGRLV